MIESFADKNAALIWKGEYARKLPRDMQEDARDVLRILNEIKSLHDWQSLPHLHAHKLGGDRQGTWSLRICKGWRVTFLWNEETSTATVVHIEDYH